MCHFNKYQNILHLRTRDEVEDGCGIYVRWWKNKGQSGF